MALIELEQEFGVEPGGETAEEWKCPTFKDCAAADIHLAFFNADEHAEIHSVDGKKVLVVFEEDSLKEHAAHWEYGAKRNLDSGLYDACPVLYIRAGDYGPRPKIGKILELDKRQYRIKACADEAGVYRMELERARQ